MLTANPKSSFFSGFIFEEQVLTYIWPDMFDFYGDNILCVFVPIPLCPATEYHSTTRTFQHLSK